MDLATLERRVAAIESRLDIATPGPKQDDFVVIGDLMWHRATSPERMTFKAAEAYCKALTIGGYTDWRLPTIREVLGIVDYERFDPAINTQDFPDTKSAAYWSSSPVASAPAAYAWLVNFYHGGADYGRRDNSAFVRAVRSVAPVTP